MASCPAHSGESLKNFEWLVAGELHGHARSHYVGRIGTAGILGEGGVSGCAAGFGSFLRVRAGFFTVGDLRAGFILRTAFSDRFFASGFFFTGRFAIHPPVERSTLTGAV